MRRFGIAAVTLALAGLPLAAQAYECVPVTEQADADVTIAGHRYYFANDFCLSEWCPNSFWIYEETNGRDGLQRNDGVSGDQTCGQFPSDTIIF